MHHRRAFTLIELLVVIAIIAILAALLVALGIAAMRIGWAVSSPPASAWGKKLSGL